jgi:DNA-binding transcriptional LysR family regulator
MQYFKAVCDYGGVSKAAEAIHVSQPSISIAIRELENEFGVALFRRENKQMLLTDEGVFFYKQAGISLGELESLAIQMTDMGSSNRRISLNMPVLSAAYFFTYLMEGFKFAHSDITFEVKQNNFNKALKMLGSDTSDLAIVVDNGTIPEKFGQLTVLSTEFVYCVSSEHPLAGRDVVGFVDLSNEQLILNQDDSFMTTQVKKRFYELGLVPNILLYAVQLSLIKELLYTKMAGTFLSKELANMIPETVGIPLEHSIYLNYALVWKKDGYMRHGVKKFIEYIKEKCAPPTPSL